MSIGRGGPVCYGRITLVVFLRIDWRIPIGVNCINSDEGEGSLKQIDGRGIRQEVAGFWIHFESRVNRTCL